MDSTFTSDKIRLAYLNIITEANVDAKTDELEQKLEDGQVEAVIEDPLVQEFLKDFGIQVEPKQKSTEKKVVKKPQEFSKISESEGDGIADSQTTQNADDGVDFDLLNTLSLNEKLDELQKINESMKEELSQIIAKIGQTNAETNEKLTHLKHKVEVNEQDIKNIIPRFKKALLSDGNFIKKITTALARHARWKKIKSRFVIIALIATTLFGGYKYVQNAANTPPEQMVKQVEIAQNAAWDKPSKWNSMKLTNAKVRSGINHVANPRLLYTKNSQRCN